MKQYVDAEYIVKLRRKLHQYPEIGYELPNTLSIVKSALDEIGATYTEKFCKGSLVGYINPEKEGCTVALRADMDALPVEEKADVPFRSMIPGQMHACGHDAHTACLLGVIRALYPIKETLPARVKFIFQPNEEGAESAAGILVRNGVLDDVDYILGLHVDNDVESGAVGVCAGPCMASCRNFTVEIQGKTAHATIPHTGQDALAAAVEFYSRMQTMLARQVDPKEPFVLGIGAMHAGNAHNVVPDYAALKGTIRAYNMESEAFVFRRIQEIARSAADSFGCRAKVYAEALLPPVYNDPGLTEQVRVAAENVAENVVTVSPKMGSEDFADYLINTPGVFFRIGTGVPGKKEQTALHANDFVIDESGLGKGADTMIQFILNLKEGE